MAETLGTRVYVLIDSCLGMDGSYIYIYIYIHIYIYTKTHTEAEDRARQAVEALMHDRSAWQPSVYTEQKDKLHAQGDSGAESNVLSSRYVCYACMHADAYIRVQMTNFTPNVHV
jgi:hypothetical protein